MDPLTHIVVGRAVVAAVDRHEPALRGVGWAAVLGALSPDIDSAVALSGWDRYVRVHEVGTHSILGALMMAWLTAAVVKGGARLRGGDPKRVALQPLFGAAIAGAMSHIVLDVVSGARIRVGWPIVSPVATLPCIAMADPWLIGICVAGLLALWPALSDVRARGVEGPALSDVRALGVEGPALSDVRARGVEGPALSDVRARGVEGPGRRPLQTVSRALLAAAIVLLGIKGVLLARALRGSNFSSVPLTAVEAQWGSLTEWQVFERTPTELRAWSVSGRGDPRTIVMSEALGPETPLVRISRSLDAVQNFLAVHEFAFPVEKPAGLGRTEVLWSDLRYCWPTRPDDAPLVRTGGSISCGVWAGALFGTDSMPLTQLVKVGAVTQTRPVRR